MKVRIALAALAAMTVVGCSDKTTPTGERSPSGEPPVTGFRAALVLDTGGVSDKSFNQSAWEGLQRASKEFGFEPKYVESSTPADYATNLTALANQKYTVIFAVGFRMGDALKEVAPKFPDVKFAIIDGEAPATANALSLIFREQEGSFLVGYLAGKTTKSNIVGFVGGMEGSLIKKFETGYRAGVKTANPKAEVKIGYVGNFDDIGKGNALALTQFEQGADVIYHAAGRAGDGVIQAAKSKGEGFFAIGVDKDQDDVAPGRVLTSMVKRVDNAVYETVKKAKEGTFQPGAVEFGVKDKGVGPSELKFTKAQFAPETLAELERLTALIAEGKLVPPATADELKTFIPPPAK